MILPSKHLPQDRALLTVGAVILRNLPQPLTVSALWESLSRSAAASKSSLPLRYDAFVLALDLLFIIGAVELLDGLLVRRPS
jgi:hypothetical protein